MYYWDSTQVDNDGGGKEVVYTVKFSCKVQGRLLFPIVLPM